MYDCIILDRLGCDVTVAMCNNKTLTPVSVLPISPPRVPYLPLASPSAFNNYYFVSLGIVSILNECAGQILGWVCGEFVASLVVYNIS